MNYKNILITGGAGFVGSHLAVRLKESFSEINITALDNLKRSGSELNVPTLNHHGVTFVHGDVRNPSDLAEIIDADLIIECSAEASVLAGVNSSPRYALETNLMGAMNCFEYARIHRSDVIFLSTSRVYPLKNLQSIEYIETDTRFEIAETQAQIGVSREGINEEFSVDGTRSLYGTTKLSAEYILQEYIEMYGINAVINRCGIITGPGQMGYQDQGIIVYWLARHIFQDVDLTYMSFGGTGKQVRDCIHVEDLADALIHQLSNMKKHSGMTYNLGGGREQSLSLYELTQYSQEITKKKVTIHSSKKTRPHDIPIYISDTSRFRQKNPLWKCNKSIVQTLEDTADWIINNKSALQTVLKP